MPLPLPLPQQHAVLAVRRGSQFRASDAHVLRLEAIRGRAARAAALQLVRARPIQRHRGRTGAPAARAVLRTVFPERRGARDRAHDAHGVRYRAWERARHPGVRGGEKFAHPGQLFLPQSGNCGLSGR